MSHDTGKLTEFLDDYSDEESPTPPPPPPEEDEETPPPPPEEDDDLSDDDLSDVESIRNKPRGLYDSDTESDLDSLVDVNQAESTTGVFTHNMSGIDDDDEDSDDYSEDEDYLQKFDTINKQDMVAQYHPELLMHNNEEIKLLSKVVRNRDGIIFDPLHRTLPFITKYERARVIGERAHQINMGAKPTVEVAQDLIDGYQIAMIEFEQKKLPFIIKRPLPNGGCEYWKVKDLEVV